MNKQAHRRRITEQGFTIIELLIATAILSTILVLVTVLMINIGNLYYKGFNEGRLQDNVRSNVEEIAQRLELSGGTGAIPHVTDVSGTQAYCIGTTRYSFVLNKQIGTDTTHVLWRDTVPPGSCMALSQTNLNDATVGAELIAPHSRLTAFTIDPSKSPYTVSIGEAYGDHDLLVNSNSINATCKGGTGDQFCATAALTITVTQRLAGH